MAAALKLEQPPSSQAARRTSLLDPYVEQIKDLLAKSLGSGNPANVVKATLDALKQLRPKEAIFQLRGKTVKAPAPAGEAATAETKTEAPADAKPAKGKGKKKADKSDDANPALAS